MGTQKCLGAAGALEVGDEVLALSGLLDTGEDHLGALWFEWVKREEGGEDMGESKIQGILIRKIHLIGGSGCRTHHHFHFVRSSRSARPQVMWSPASPSIR